MFTSREYTESFIDQSITQALTIATEFHLTPIEAMTISWSSCHTTPLQNKMVKSNDICFSCMRLLRQKLIHENNTPPYENTDNPDPTEPLIQLLNTGLQGDYLALLKEIEKLPTLISNYIQTQQPTWAPSNTTVNDNILLYWFLGSLQKVTEQTCIRLFLFKKNSALKGAIKKSLTLLDRHFMPETHLIETCYASEKDIERSQKRKHPEWHHLSPSLSMQSIHTFFQGIQTRYPRIVYQNRALTHCILLLIAAILWQTNYSPLPILGILAGIKLAQSGVTQSRLFSNSTQPR